MFVRQVKRFSRIRGDIVQSNASFIGNELLGFPVVSRVRLNTAAGPRAWRPSYDLPVFEAESCAHSEVEAIFLCERKVARISRPFLDHFTEVLSSLLCRINLGNKFNRSWINVKKHFFSWSFFCHPEQSFDMRNSIQRQMSPRQITVEQFHQSGHPVDGVEHVRVFFVLQSGNVEQPSKLIIVQND